MSYDIYLNDPVTGNRLDSGCGDGGGDSRRADRGAVTFTEKAMHMWYDLDRDHVVIPVDEAYGWLALEKDRRVRIDSFEIDGQTVTVSTVFLVINHRLSTSGEGVPILFETMVSGGELDGKSERASTWQDALGCHHAMVARVLGYVEP